MYMNAFAELIRQYLSYQMAQLDVFGLVCIVMLCELGCYFAVKVLVVGFLEGGNVVDIVKRPIWTEGPTAIAWCGTATAAVWWSSWLLR